MKRIELPKFKQQNKNDCGPTALRIVSSYLGKEVTSDALYSLANIKTGEGFWTIDLGIVAKKLGFDCSVYTKNLGVVSENLELYKSMTTANEKEVNEKFVNAKKIGLACYEKQFSLEEIILKISREELIISLIDWNIIEPKKDRKYQGHFVVLSGYDDKNIYFLDPFKGTEENITKELYDLARKSNGTDEDLLIFTPASLQHQI